MEMKKPSTHYTYADYATWPDDVRYELIDGVPYMMSAPGREHQRVSGELFRQLANYLEGKACEVYAAPFDVRLNADAADDTVVQPDLLVVCDLRKLDDKGCKGAPDLMVEITSPSSARHDSIVKFRKYLEAGVREYWIADPENEVIRTYVLDAGRYIGMAYGGGDSMPVAVLEGCHIDLSKVFPQPEAQEGEATATASPPPMPDATPQP